MNKDTFIFTWDMYTGIHKLGNVVHSVKDIEQIN